MAVEIDLGYWRLRCEETVEVEDECSHALTVEGARDARDANTETAAQLC